MADILELESSYTIKNLDPDNPFRGKYGPKKYFLIPPGKSRSVPREYAHMWFGDPAITDPEDRYFRLTQLRCLYGVMLPSEDALKFPKIQVFDGDSDERVFMLFEDQAGEKAARAIMSGESDKVELDPQVAALREELRDTKHTLALILEQLKIVQGGNGPAHNGPIAEPLVEPAEPVDPISGLPVGAVALQTEPLDDDAALDAIDATDAATVEDVTAAVPDPTSTVDKPIKVRG